MVLRDGQEPEEIDTIHNDLEEDLTGTRIDLHLPWAEDARRVQARLENNQLVVERFRWGVMMKPSR
jgi:hypothetical protein